MLVWLYELFQSLIGTTVSDSVSIVLTLGATSYSNLIAVYSGNSTVPSLSFFYCSGKEREHSLSAGKNRESCEVHEMGNPND